MSPPPAVLVDARAEQAWNDAVLAQPLRHPSWRLWRYAQPAVVMGRAQRGLLAPADGPDLAIVERQAGGGAVLVGPWMLSWSIALPADHALVAGRSIAASYAEIGEALARALVAEGVPARPAAVHEARKAIPSVAWACFAGITAHEVLVDGRKVVGFAQRRQRTGALLVGGVLVDAVPWVLLVRAVAPLLQAGPAPVPPPDERRLVQDLERETISIAEALGRPPDAEALARRIAVHIEALLG